MTGTELAIFLAPMIVGLIAVSVLINAAANKDKTMANVGVLTLMVAAGGMLAYFVIFGG